MKEFCKLYSDGQEASEAFFLRLGSYDQHPSTIRAAVFKTDCDLESRCLSGPYSSELQLSNTEVIKA